MRKILLELKGGLSIKNYLSATTKVKTYGVMFKELRKTVNLEFYIPSCHSRMKAKYCKDILE